MRKFFFALAAVILVSPVLVGGCKSSPTSGDREAEENVAAVNDDGGADAVNAPIAERDAAEVKIGGSRPGSVPADLPNVVGAGNFGWLSIGGSDMFSYEVNGDDYRAVCEKQLELLRAAGWQASDAYEMDVAGALIKTLEKPEYAVMVTCGDNSDEDAVVKTISVTLNRTKR